MNFLVRMQKVTNRINKIVSRCFTEIRSSEKGFGRCAWRLRASWLIKKAPTCRNNVFAFSNNMPKPVQVPAKPQKLFLISASKVFQLSSFPTQSLLLLVHNLPSEMHKNCFSYRRLSCHYHTVASFYLQTRIVAHLLVVHGTVSYHSRLFVLLTVIICNT